MAKRRSRIRRKKLVYLQVNTSLSTGALAALDVVQSDFPQNLDESFKVVYVKLFWTTSNMTPGEGPIMCGIAHSDYTATEVEECLEASTSWDRGNRIGNEHAARMVRRAVAFPLTSADETTNDGKAIYQKLYWPIATGETLALWIRNTGPNTLTSGGDIRVDGVAAGFYL